MGHLVTAPYGPADGAEYVAYHRRLEGEIRRLQGEGRLPDDEGVAWFFDYIKGVVDTVNRDVLAAQSRGTAQVVSRIEMSAADFRRRRDLKDNLLNLLEILQLRKAVDLQRTDGAKRVADALGAGTFEE